MNLCKLTCLVAAAALLILAPSCGYHMGSMMPDIGVESIAIAEIKNETKEPLLSAIARNQIAAAFQTDNSLKLKSREKADCILYCRIVSVETSSIRYDTNEYNTDSYRPSEFRVTITAEFQVVIPGRSNPMIPMRTVRGTANYEYNADPQSGRILGLRQACYNLARLIVQYTTEAW